MALAYSNLTGSGASAALNKKLKPTPSIAAPTDPTRLNLSGVGKPAAPAITNQNLVPSYVQSKPATTKPATTIAAPRPTTSTPAAAPAPVTGTDGATDQLAGLYKQLAEKQALLKTTQEKEAAEKKQPKKEKPGKEEAPITYGGLVGDLSKLGKEGSAGYQKANEALVKFRTNSANYKAGIFSAPTSARVMQGRDQAVQLANAQTDAALATGVQNALAQETNQITALNNAGALAAPVSVAPGTTLSSPLTGDTVAGGLGGYANYQTAEQVMSLIRQYPDAGYVYDQTKTPQENLQAFQSGALQRSPTYQKSTYGAPGAQTVAGGSVIQTAQAGYQQAYQDYQNLNTQFTNADGQANLLLQAVKSSGINSSDARFANKTVNEIRRQLSSADLQVFDSALKATQAAYGNLLVSGGGTVPSEATAAYNIILNPNASLASFEAALNQLKREGQVKLNAQGQQVNTYFGQLQGAAPGGNATNTSGNVFAEQW